MRKGLDYGNRFKCMVKHEPQPTFAGIVVSQESIEKAVDNYTDDY